MQTAASNGKNVLVDRATKKVVWRQQFSEPTPFGMYPNSYVVRAHEINTCATPMVGDTYNG